jgi:hypothetical protein
MTYFLQDQKETFGEELKSSKEKFKRDYEEAKQVAEKFERETKNLTQDLDAAQQENRLLKVRLKFEMHLILLISLRFLLNRPISLLWRVNCAH